MRTWLILIALLVTGLAGCADSTPVEDDDGFSEEFDEELEATEDTGIIRGVVVDVTITPIAEAKVLVEGVDKETLTNENGEFGFAELSPGFYFLKVSKLGYGTQRTQIEVVAGDDRPPILRVQLEADASNLPTTTLETFDGYLQCGAGLGPAGSLNACALADSVNVFDTFISPGLNTTQLEMTWEGTNAFGDGLDIGIYDPSSLASNFKGVDGPSPQVLQATGDEIAAYYGEDATAYTFRIFPGNAPQGANPGISIVLEQRVEIFVTGFYGFQPDEGWMFIVDGEHPIPQ